MADTKLIDKIDQDKLSPMMKQYLKQKEAWSDCLLFFRLGDFYELFFDDAIIASEALDIALTSRDCGLESRAPMCGVPHHAVDQYLKRLIDQDFKVAICEQMQDPATVKGIVDRQVVRIITPGTLTNIEQLDARKNHYLVALHAHQNYYGLAYLDITTGEFQTTAIAFGQTMDKLLGEISRLDPSELLVHPADFPQDLLTRIQETSTCHITRLETLDTAQIQSFIADTFSNHFDHLWQPAVAALLYYLNQTQRDIPIHIDAPNWYDLSTFMKLNQTARRNLELTQSLKDQHLKGSLLWTIDRTKTAMGCRMLRHWIEQPLTNKADILARQSVVSCLKEAFIKRQTIRDQLRQIKDIERLISKIALNTLNARDMIALATSLMQIPNLQSECMTKTDDGLKQLAAQLADLSPLAQQLLQAINPDPPLSLKEGNLIQSGYDPQVDQLRELANGGQNGLIELENRIKQDTGIKGLKIGYNRVFGYYFEVPKSQTGSVPATFIRKQTLANAERFYTDELKQLEDNLLGAKQKLVDLEYEIFCTLRNNLKSVLNTLKQMAHALATIDVLQALAEHADRSNYCRPELIDDGEIYIENGRHPVVETVLPAGGFVPNQTRMNGEDERFLLITGPNMSGKSTYMRQVALIVLLAQMGSFVPASACRIGIADAIFTRIGASDDLAGGASTFMVEMSEVSNILAEATPKSLLIMDEIGRGTSTFDGLAIAWAVIEYLVSTNHLGARTLFSTHYHELTELEGQLSGFKNYHIKVDESQEDIVFLHQIERGPANESYGIEVAKLACIPQPVILRARDLLHQLETEGKKQRQRRKNTQGVSQDQPDLFTTYLSVQSYDHVIEKIHQLDIQMLTPLDALNILYQLKQDVKPINPKK